ncbi:MAG TPA: CAP domain-containing protein [Burkholderiales bacterium]|nr:CAP domain-containing protein [Burkholderiales bacterium]
MPLKRSTRIALILGAGVAAYAAMTFLPADDPETLLQLVNAYRSAPGACAGKRVPPLGPLAPSPALAKADVGSSQALPEALKRAGYSASEAQAIVLSGSRRAGATMAVLKERYCDALLSPQFAEAGIARDGTRWTLVLARPLLSTDLGDWRAAGQEVLRLVNEARAKPRSCGDRKFDAARPVEWQPKLALASLAHSRDMARRNYFAHQSQGGTVASDRADTAGYRWTRVGENIAAGQGSPKQVVAGWLLSPSHCVNIMESAFTEMGAAYALDPDSDAKIYWTQLFGVPEK